MNRFFHARRAGRGLSLIEAALVMSLAAVVLVGIVTYVTHASRQLKLRNDAQHFSVVMHAAEAYIAANRATLSGSPSQTVTVADLKTANFLPAAFSTTVGQQNMEILIRSVTVAGKPDVEALLISYGGRDYDDAEVGQMVSTIGGSAGFMRRGETVINGVASGWSTPINAGTPHWTGIAGHHGMPASGHLAALVSGISDPRLTDTWLARVDLGTTQRYLNRMDTSLGMAGKATIGTDCPQVGWFNSTPGGEPVFCKMSRSKGRLVWATQAQIARLDQVNTYTINTHRGSGHHDVYTYTAATDTFVVLEADGSQGNNLTHFGCWAAVEIEPTGFPFFTASSNRMLGTGSDKSERSCTASAFVPKGWRYRLTVNDGWGDLFGYRGNGRRTLFTSDFD